MTQVTGIGGVFFRARDPEGLMTWYRTHLGIEDFARTIWRQGAGPTVFAPFAADTDYFPADRQWMINFRVADLDGLIVRLEGEGIAVEQRDEWNGTAGRFARIHDPEGNPIELWQPPDA
ncbi:MAG: VOC family protein [Pseudomonadota bacterium]